jgi:hypothetical protein
MHYEEEDDEGMALSGPFRFMRRFSLAGTLALPLAFVAVAVAPLLGDLYWIALLVGMALIGVGWIGSVLLTRLFSMGVSEYEE